VRVTTLLSILLLCVIAAQSSAAKPQLSAEDHFRRGVELYQKLDMDGAIAEYRAAIRLNPNYAEAHHNLGNALRSKGDQDGAIAEYRIAIQLKPDFPEAHSSLGVALKVKGDLDGAIAEYRTALRFDPNVALTHYYLGFALGLKGDLDAAIAEYRVAIQLNLDTPYIHNDLGDALRKKGDLEGANAEYRNALRPNPNNAGARNNLANAPKSQSSISTYADFARLARQGYIISADRASELEETLTKDPNDLAARAQLLGYYFVMGGGRLSPAAARQARLRHIIWLVQNHPDSELAGLSAVTIDPASHPLADREGYEKVKALWLEQARNHDDNAVLLANAAWFFKLPDKAIAVRLIKRTHDLDPANRNWSAFLGQVYAAAIEGLTGMNENRFPTAADPNEARGAFAQQAREELVKSQDATVVGTAGYYLMFWNSILSASGKAPADLLDFAEQLLARAQALDPASVEWPQDLANIYLLRAAKAASPEERAALLHKQWELLDKTADLTKGLDTLLNLVRAAFDASEFERAQMYARRLLEVAPQNRDDPLYGLAIHHGNLVLGRLALRADNVDKAKTFLLAAARTPGGPQLSSFGPNMSLAQELLDRGEKQTVLEYLELCKAFWTNPRNSLDRWIETIKSGGTPDFGANLNY
jgi:tetratricopeptide (TPR) repeat protein